MRAAGLLGACALCCSSRLRARSISCEDLDGGSPRGLCTPTYPLVTVGPGAPASGPPARAFGVARTLAGGDSLYHAVGIALRFAEDGVDTGMLSPFLPPLAMRLRELAVEALASRGRHLILGGRATIAAGDLVAMAAKRRLGPGATSIEYLRRVYELGEWAGGAELVALANELRRPVRVYEPCAWAHGGSSGGSSGGTIGVREIAALCSPTYDNASALHVLALDTLRWRCDDDAEGVVHCEGGSYTVGAASGGGAEGGEGAAAAAALLARTGRDEGDDQGVLFHALLPRAAPATLLGMEGPDEAGRVSSADDGGDPDADPAAAAMRARLAASPRALAEVAAIARDPRVARALAAIQADPSRLGEYARDPELAPLLARVLQAMSNRKRST